MLLKNCILIHTRSYWFSRIVQRTGHGLQKCIKYIYDKDVKLWTKAIMKPFPRNARNIRMSPFLIDVLWYYNGMQFRHRTCIVIHISRVRIRDEIYTSSYIFSLQFGSRIIGTMKHFVEENICEAASKISIYLFFLVQNE